jgi:hypothetical protein
MKENTGIFIFTKDKPKSLKSTLDSLNNCRHKVFIIDDSIRKENIESCRHLLNDTNHQYFGRREFILFTKGNKIELKKFPFLLRQLGNVNWNLGYARNFALVVAKSLYLKKVLFMDDDIIVHSPGQIDTLFTLLGEYDFAGAHISGLVDDSILGHIATELGIYNERMLSGGFMTFNPFKIEHYFLNNYNEDWIWLFLHLNTKRQIQTSEVFQSIGNPFHNYKRKILFQEFGETALDGILDLYPGKLYESLTSEVFWQRMIKERMDYLNHLFDCSEKKNLIDYMKIINYVIANSSALDPKSFTNLFSEYFSNLTSFKKLFNSL